jgi:pyruvate kinase
VNIFRINMSHAKHETVRALVPRVRQVAEEAGKVIGILLDTQGPAIRTGDLPAKIQLKKGDIFEFTVRGEAPTEAMSVGVNYDHLVEDLHVGDPVIVDNGLLHMRVLSKTENALRCEVLTPGEMGSRRHINLPGIHVKLPALTEKDLADVALGAELRVDFVALSFCRFSQDVEQLRSVLLGYGSTARIVAKIEDQLAVGNLEGIIEAADAIMVARGDLGIECAMEDLPIIQRKIVKRCIALGRPVIVATQMLESMITNPVPTRAEVTDVANAVFEEADAIMLSGETSVGKYPVECVGVLVKIAKRIERSGGLGFAQKAILDTDREKTANAAVTLANSFPEAKIVVFTKRGILAGYVAGLRPERAPIHAFTPTWEQCRKMSIHRGLTPHQLDFAATPAETVAAAEKVLLAKGLAKTGDHLIIVADIFTGDSFDGIQLRRIGG